MAGSVNEDVSIQRRMPLWLFLNDTFNVVLYPGSEQCCLTTAIAPLKIWRTELVVGKIRRIYEPFAFTFVLVIGI